MTVDSLTDDEKDGYIKDLARNLEPVPEQPGDSLAQNKDYGTYFENCEVMPDGSVLNGAMNKFLGTASRIQPLPESTEGTDVV